MIREEDAVWILEQLEQLASKLGINVRYEYLGEKDDDVHLRSGSCRVKGDRVIIIDRFKSKGERCRLLASELKRCDLSRVFITPAVRDILEA